MNIRATLIVWMMLKEMASIMIMTKMIVNLFG